jgi:hypothetical protein
MESRVNIKRIMVHLFPVIGRAWLTCQAASLPKFHALERVFNFVLNASFIKEN